MVQLMPLSCRELLLHENPEWFTFLVLTYAGCPGKKAKRPFNGCSSSSSGSGSGRRRRRRRCS